MRIRQLLALFRRHLVAASVVIILGVGLAWDIGTAPPTYRETANVVFLVPGTGNPYSTLGPELIPIASFITASMDSTEYRSKVRAAGATAASDVAMVNLHNQQFPVYGVPYITVTAESADPVATSRTFSLVLGMVRDLDLTRQTRLHVPHWSLVATRVVGYTGVRASRGSTKRALAGLALLTVMLLFMVVISLDRHPLPRNPLSRRLTPVLRLVQR